MSEPRVAPPRRAQIVTDDLEEGTAFLQAAYACDLPTRLRGDRTDFRLVSTAVTTERVTIGRVQYGADVDLTVGGTPSYLLTSIRSGHYRYEREGEDLRFGPGDTHVLAPTRSYRTRLTDPDVDGLSLDPAAVADAAAEHTGRDAGEVGPIDFELTGPVSAAAARYWRSCSSYVVTHALDTPGAADSALLRDGWVRLLAAALLSCFRNDAALEQAWGAHWSAPSGLRRATAWLDEHAADPVGVTDVAAAVGLTPRAVQIAFRRHLDTTPTGYLRRVRLERAHQELQAAGPAAGETVAAVAARWGFAHPGRFSTYYQQVYGVPPSTTLRA